MAKRAGGAFRGGGTFLPIEKVMEEGDMALAARREPAWGLSGHVNGGAFLSDRRYGVVVVFKGLQ